MASWTVRLATVALCVAVASCGTTQMSDSASMPGRDPSGAMRVTSTAFAEGGAIPTAHTCDGENASPPLTWSGLPDGTRELALIVDDPDARGFVHWVAYGIPPAPAGLPESASGSGAFVEGVNDFRDAGYGGPCPPSGAHRYAFRLFALSAPLSLAPGATAAQVRSAISDAILGEAVLIGTYRRG